MTDSAQDLLSTRILADAAVRALRETGLKPEKTRGRGGRNWTIEENGIRKPITIRTTRDRDIAFSPLPNRGWKTLDDVDIVIVAAVDRPDSPTEVLVYRFDAAEVRRRFNESRDAADRKGNTVSLNAGWWVSLDKTRRNRPGEGIAATHEPIHRFPIEELAPPAPDPQGESAGRPWTTFDEIMSDARKRLATLFGVNVDRIKVDFRIEDR